MFIKEDNHYFNYYRKDLVDSLFRSFSSQMVLDKNRTDGK